MIRVIYSEAEKYAPVNNLGYESTIHEVGVEIRQWENDDYCDTVMETVVVVEGKKVSSKIVCETDEPNKLVRMGIKEFDRLIAAHPYYAGRQL